MDQKQVKIIGLKLNHQLGIVQACDLVFDEKNKLIVFKGGVGDGKTTLQKGLQLGTQGSKTLVDNNLYGEIDTEVQLIDGDYSIWVGCKSSGNKLQHVLYTKDSEGKKIKNPVIDGVEATPSKYLQMLQTELTWKMDELTSENPTIQKKILLKLYQYGLKKIGIIFDKTHPDYKNSILGKIDDSVQNRDEKDMIRKTKGGIADDLKLKGIDPDRPGTCPDFINIQEIEQKIKEAEKELTTKELNLNSVKEKELAELKSDAQEVVNRCLVYNKKLKAEYDEFIIKFNQNQETYKIITSNLDDIAESLAALGIANWEEIHSEIEKKVNYPKEIDKPNNPEYIIFDESNMIQKSNYEKLDPKARELIIEIDKLRHLYIQKSEETNEFDPTELKNKIKEFELSKYTALENNKIVEAIDAFHNWRKANEIVVQLNDEYVKLLSHVDTGVEGLKIMPVDDEIYLMYNGVYDSTYFNNPNLEYRKLSSYSGTQKPVICLLIQNYLLSKKDKAMRYMYIDNIPIDNKTRSLLEKMGNELNLTIFLNITGDFVKSELVDGEILIEGGEIFF